MTSGIPPSVRSLVEPLGRAGVTGQANGAAAGGETQPFFLVPRRSIHRLTGEMPETPSIPSQSRHVVAIIGGAVAGSEAAAVCAERGITAIVLEQNDRPFGKIEDGLPRWHDKLRQKEYAHIGKNLSNRTVLFVPRTQLGRDLSARRAARRVGRERGPAGQRRLARSPAVRGLQTASSGAASSIKTRSFTGTITTPRAATRASASRFTTTPSWWAAGSPRSTSSRSSTSSSTSARSRSAASR